MGYDWEAVQDMLGWPDEYMVLLKAAYEKEKKEMEENESRRVRKLPGRQS